MTIKTCGMKEAIETLVRDPLWADKDKGPKQVGPVSYGVGLCSYRLHERRPPARPPVLRGNGEDMRRRHG